MPELIYITESLEEFAAITEAAKKPAPQRSWKCQECGKLLTQKQAEKVMYGDKGCPKCGGSDIDLADTMPRGRMKEAKRPTFQQAREGIFKYLESRGWTVKASLKVPHATDRNGQWRLYFKPQAVYLDYDSGRRSQFSLNDARSIFTDIRDLTPEEFLAKVNNMLQKEHNKGPQY